MRALLVLLTKILAPAAASGDEEGAMNVRFDTRPYVRLAHPEWSRDAAIYQVNVRQFSPEGTFRAAQAQLPRLKNLGVRIVWLMPVHPIVRK